MVAVEAGLPAEGRREGVSEAIQGLEVLFQGSQVGQTGPVRRGRPARRWRVGFILRRRHFR